MMDEADQAQIFEERYLNGAIAASRREAHRVPISRVWCEDCGVRIPAARLSAVPGCTRCVKCQMEFEKERP